MTLFAQTHKKELMESYFDSVTLNMLSYALCMVIKDAYTI